MRAPARSARLARDGSSNRFHATFLAGRVMIELFRPKYDIRRNRIHVVSLSCNPVPPARYGGIELVVAHLCEGLADLGAGVVCYSPGEFSLQSVEHFRTLAVPSTPWKDGGVPNTPAHLRMVQRRLDGYAERGDVVILNHPDHYGFLARNLSFRTRVKVHMHEVAHWTGAGMKSSVIYPSEALRKAVGKPGVVIPHGQKLKFGDPSLPKEDFLFFAGRISREKGVDIALAACKKLGIRLVLAGPLDDKTLAAEILEQPTVEYLGELTYEELVPYYARARGMVYMTQLLEAFGLSVIEAMAASCPVLTTGRGGTGETVVDGKTGFFCESVDDIVRAYSRLPLLKPSECVSRAREYSVQRMAASYLELFAA
jgi:glycosyltransferase involved in cell wall biosynthesis